VLAAVTHTTARNDDGVAQILERIFPNGSKIAQA
jgi:hypothetical protein